MSFAISYKQKVLEEDIPRLSSSVAMRIQAAIQKKLALDPVYFGKPLRYELKGARSMRVGDYRVIYDVNVREKSIMILAIGHRRDIYDQ